MFRVIKIAVSAVFIFTSLHGMTAAMAGSPLTVSRAIAAPPGFAQACTKYGWLCASPGGAVRQSSIDPSILAHVNRAVNASIQPVEDRRNYGKNEFWTLPDNESGDCEDYALLKKKRLIESGVPAGSMALAVVLDRRGNNHVVLVVRTGKGDVILDNLSSSIKDWSSTGYTFLARQSFDNKRTWNVALAGPGAQQTARSESKQLSRPAAATGPLSFLDGR